MYGKCEQLIGWLQKQGVLLNQHQCPHCEQECRIDSNLKLFHDKSIINSRDEKYNFKMPISLWEKPLQPSYPFSSYEYTSYYRLG